MSYRKRIKICKGVKLNLSGSGVSVTIGGKGASVSVGKRGTYLNTSIPGTGIYSRKKISSSTKSKRKTSETFNTKEAISSVEFRKPKTERTVDPVRVENYLSSQQNYLPSDSIEDLRELILNVGESEFLKLESIKFKNPYILLVISIFFGFLGIDSFMLGKTGRGILKLLTIGLFCILWAIDVFKSIGDTKKYNLESIMRQLVTFEN